MLAKPKIILCWLTLLAFAGPVQADEWLDFPFIFTTGKAQKDVPPNMATVKFEVKAFDENPAKALETVKQRSKEIAQLCRQLNIAEKDITAYDINKQAVREHKDYTELKLLGYEITQKYSLQLPGLTAYVPLLEKLLSIKNVVDLKPHFDVAERKQIEAELTAAAIADGRAYAEQMAAGAGAKLGGVYAISEIPFPSILGSFYTSQSYLAERFAHHMRAGDYSIVYIPSTITIEKAVNLIYKLEP